MAHLIYIRFFRSSDPARVDDVGKWLANHELPALFAHPAVRQAVLYRDLHVPEMQQPDFFTLYRIETQQRERTQREIRELLAQASERNPLPAFLSQEEELFYEESHRCKRVEPRMTAYKPTLTGPGTNRYAMYGFSHSGDETRRAEFITWYQAERQHDVLRPFFPFENAAMWLLCDGESYEEYIFTLYEFSSSDLIRTMDILQGAYAALNWLRSSDLYVTGYAGVLEEVRELVKES